MESYFLGFDPADLSERFDVDAAQRRLDELADERSTAALAERIGLLRVTGRLEEAAEAATEALRQARLAGDREPLCRAKIARAQLLRVQGRHEQAITELSDAIAEATANGWPSILADARRQRALVRVALGEDDAAREDFNEALAVLVRHDADPIEIDLTMVAVGALLDRAAAEQELTTCAEEAEGQGWSAIAAFAYQHRGKTHYDAGDFDQARDDFKRALFLRQESGAPDDQLESMLLAIEAADRRRADAALAG